jgi:glucans biosynthesis protein C
MSGPEVAPPPAPAERVGSRMASVDNLKVLLVAGVIVAHATMAWTGLRTWVFTEPPVRDPLLTVLAMAELVGALFGMAAFFLVAGTFTPGSLSRKGPWRFVADRAVRLGVPLAFYALVLSPVVEYADPDAAGWTRGFPAFVLHVWWPPVPGPTWFLAVLLAFSVGYAVLRALRPARPAAAPLRGRTLVAAGVAVAVASYAVRWVVPLGTEVGHLALGQAPAWTAGFVLGVVGAERGWVHRLPAALSRRLFRVAMAASAGCAVVMGIVGAVGGDLEAFAGGGSWPSLVVAALEGALVVAMPLWLLDVFRRRLDHQGRLARECGRGAFAAFVVHQVVLVGLVLASRLVPWPPEAKLAAVAVLGVAISFGIGSLLVRVPGVSRII